MSLTKGLVGHWRLDEESFNPATKRFTDQSAYCNHGTGNGTQLGSVDPGFQADRMGQLVRAAPFNGSDDYINVPHKSVLEPEEITISVWVNADTWTYAAPGWTGIISKRNPGSTGPWNLFVVEDAEPDQRKIAFVQYRTSVSSSVKLPNILNTGQWYNIVGVIGSDKVAKLYLDEVWQADGGVGSGTLITNANKDVTIGVQRTGVNENFDGSINEVRIYNRALSQQEITLLYESYRV